MDGPVDQFLNILYILSTLGIWLGPYIELSLGGSFGGLSLLADLRFSLLVIFDDAANEVANDEEEEEDRMVSSFGQANTSILICNFYFKRVL